MTFTTQRRRASQLRQWHIETRTALDDRELMVLNLIAQHLPVPNAVLGMTDQEVTDYFEDARRELDAAVSLLALAEAEAVLRTDFLSRVQKKAKDPVSRDFRKLYGNKGESIRPPKLGRTYVTQDVFGISGQLFAKLGVDGWS